MKNLDISICRLMKEARRGLGMSQSELAAEVGCKQSALSMFEQGDPTKLNDETVEKLSKRLNVDLSPQREVVAKPSFAESGLSFCPNPACPSNSAYLVENRRFLLPDAKKADPVGGKFCALCGEILERKCPNCGSRLHQGAVCSFCGEPYIHPLDF